MNEYSSRWQGMILVLYALNELSGTNTKQEVIEYISRRKWYDVTKHDLPPYEGRNEPQYHTLLAWARKDLYERELLIPTDLKDDWAISRDGRLVMEKLLELFTQQKFEVKQCYLWTPRFKKVMDSTYEPGPDDAERPEVQMERAAEMFKSLFK